MANMMAAAIQAEPEEVGSVLQQLPLRDIRVEYYRREGGQTFTLTNPVVDQGDMDTRGPKRTTTATSWKVGRKWKLV